VLSLIVVILAVSPAVHLAQSNQPPKDRYVAVNGIRLHYVEWSTRGDALLFLTSFGGSAHEFDTLAPSFASRFRVLAVTRRGQPPSDQPPTGYDPRTLAEDIRAFLDAMGIDKVTLAGYSIAGVEETLFASRYPERVSRLVYLDALGDPKSAYELATNPATQYPLPLPDPPGPLSQIARGARQADPDYTKVQAPALAFAVIYDKPFVPPNAGAQLRARLIARYQQYGQPFEEKQRAHFRRDMKRGRIVELRGTDHSGFMKDPSQQAIIVREMLKFLSEPSTSRQ
jgi:pimeloyl-ACP methyl ester carboxylesterase